MSFSLTFTRLVCYDQHILDLESECKKEHCNECLFIIIKKKYYRAVNIKDVFYFIFIH